MSKAGARRATSRPMGPRPKTAEGFAFESTAIGPARRAGGGRRRRRGSGRGLPVDGAPAAPRFGAAAGALEVAGGAAGQGAGVVRQLDHQEALLDAFAGDAGAAGGAA